METIKFIEIKRNDNIHEFKHQDHDALVASYVAPEPLPFLKNLSPEQLNQLVVDEKLNLIRNIRNSLLASSDWTQNADSPLSTEKKAEWASYRKQLRDLMNNILDPFNVVFPTKPE